MKSQVLIYLLFTFMIISCSCSGKKDTISHELEIKAAVYSLLDKGKGLYDMYDYASAQTYYEDAYRLAMRTEDSCLIEKCTEKFIWASYRIGDYITAKNLLTSRKPTSYAGYAVSAYLNALNGNYSDIPSMLNSAWNISTSVNDTLDILFLEGQLYSLTDNYKKASESYKKYADLLSVKNSSNIRLMNTSQNITSTYTILLVVFISLIIITILIIKQKKKKRELKLLLDVATELKKNNKLNCSILEEKEKQIEALFKNQYKYINDLANNYYSYNSSPSASKIIYSYVKETLEKITKENTSTKNLENIINTYHSNAISKIREQIPNLNESYIRLYCYYCAGFSPQMISLFTNDNVDNIYKKKSRLKLKINSSDAPDRDFFISLI
ncbi:MAG: hypothetical protein E7066_09930 [Lentimicrobiaceae bacterium]|nr:hypothetical protein [Lentimicrobiaceae bacterium]